jgi:hypothetical protein
MGSKIASSRSNSPIITLTLKTFANLWTVGKWGKVTTIACFRHLLARLMSILEKQ